MLILTFVLLYSPTYNVTVSQINLGGNVADIEFHAIFDSGTSFTYLNDPAYTHITNSVSNVMYSWLRR